jgi:hypothetical protein
MLKAFVKSRMSPNVRRAARHLADEWRIHRMHQGREHKYAYDFETLRHTLSLAGFSDVRRREFDASVDAENHRIGSLCVVATK